MDVHHHFIILEAMIPTVYSTLGILKPDHELADATPFVVEPFVVAPFVVAPFVVAPFVVAPFVFDPFVVEPLQHESTSGLWPLGSEARRVDWLKVWLEGGTSSAAVQEQEGEVSLLSFAKRRRIGARSKERG